jgi:hypothetical protein
LASWFGNINIQTPQQYKEEIIKAFNGESSKLKCSVDDVFVVPDYQSFFKPFIDPHFGRYTKKEWTQHQYRFEAVTISTEFPYGSKFTYRKYSSDKVVVIDKKSIFNCTTPEGLRTGITSYFIFSQTDFIPQINCTLSGLEPKTVLSQWYPTKGLHPGRNVEGAYILLGIPSLPSGQLQLKPKALIEKCTAVLADLKRRINEHYILSDPVRLEWNNWFGKHAPSSDNVETYILSHKYACPLSGYFKSATFNMPNWRAPMPICSFTIFPPNVVVAMPSVQTQFDRHAAPTPFMAIVMEENDNEANILRRYSLIKEKEFDRLRRLQGKRLKEIVSRSFKENGSRNPTSGTIDTLCSRIFDSNLNFLTSR